MSLLLDDILDIGPALVAAIATATVAFLWLARAALYPPSQSILPNPLRTKIPYLSEKEVARLEYGPDAYPGARDVSTPYGTMRVYEWGPENGEKILFIHGISTSCMTVSVLAQAMVERGHRVMIFDLFGRGFTDGVGDLPHDPRLYVTQALLALASSPISWTGNDAFRLVGYSMGGGIAVHIAATFPHMVSSLILLAPAGLIRESNFGIVSRILFRTGLVPDALLTRLARQRLRKPIASSVTKKKSPTPSPPRESSPTVSSVLGGSSDGGGVSGHNLRHSLHSLANKESMTDIAVAEAANPGSGPVAAIEKRVLDYIAWMAEHHSGFVHAFLSSLRHAPLVNQHAVWEKLAAREPGTTCVLLARDDEVIDPDDYTDDGLHLLGGEERVRWRVVEGGHDFVMTHSEEILRELDEFWRV
ncbi:related to 2-hydroxy-6-oxo-6-phenylhexa-2,4-dienoate hydrolase [Cephalotrichum gorgonifer]|uniref:Related to 2-hydroxy-6-oxo-6-phenylhexa-2,4-dienoate hydrolase n=1 Tax=Cephalotrichum gorgonifer TaxID=2041049 RepID=A0AAE8MNU5_9PEZI|nr:related to 2-hydroxy-6-oxo-6-phenylhexa-2,4-dienoate hydrolase [Cephalotrichum gorgonifer]